MTAFAGISRLTATFAAGTLALVCLGATGAASAAPVQPDAASPAALTDSVQVTVPVRLTPAPETRALYGMTTIKIGNSRPIRVVVDTGSVGLRLLPGAWKTTPSRVQMTNRRITWATDGQRLSGKVGIGNFTIAGMTGTTPIEFMFMNQSKWTKDAAAQGIQGVLGIGLSRQDLPNPLTTLSGDVSRHWSLHFNPNLKRNGGNGQLILGAPASPRAVATIPLRTQGTSPTGHLYWDDQAADACWKFGTLDDVCGSTYFDSVAPFMLAKGSAFASLPTAKAGLLEPGTEVHMAAPGAAFYVWNFDSGLRFGDNAVKVSTSGRTLINTGSALYSTFTVTYDAVAGTVSLSQ